MKIQSAIDSAMENELDRLMIFADGDGGPQSKSVLSTIASKTKSILSSGKRVSLFFFCFLVFLFFFPHYWYRKCVSSSLFFFFFYLSILPLLLWDIKRQRLKPSSARNLRVQSTTSNTSTIPQSPASSSSFSSSTSSSLPLELNKLQPTVYSSSVPHKTPPVVPSRRPSLTARLQETMTGSFGFDDDEDDD